MNYTFIDQNLIICLLLHHHRQQCDGGEESHGTLRATRIIISRNVTHLSPHTATASSECDGVCPYYANRQF